MDVNSDQFQKLKMNHSAFVATSSQALLVALSNTEMWL